MPQITGTFTGTGQSASLTVSNSDFTISLAFAGTATVNVERSLDKGVSWKVIETFVISAEKNGFEPSSGALYRLNCTAHTNNVIYFLAAKDA